jgi:hypothetical protein
MANKPWQVDVSREVGRRRPRPAGTRRAGRSGGSPWSHTLAAALEEDYRRTAAHQARKVMDRNFCG